MPKAPDHSCMPSFVRTGVAATRTRSPRLANAAPRHMRHAELRSDLTQILGRPLELERRLPADDAQLGTQMRLINEQRQEVHSDLSGRWPAGDDQEYGRWGCTWIPASINRSANGAGRIRSFVGSHRNNKDVPT